MEVQIDSLSRLKRLAASRKIPSCQSNAKQDIYEKAHAILVRYFGDDDETDEDPTLAPQTNDTVECRHIAGLLEMDADETFSPFKD